MEFEARGSRSFERRLAARPAVGPAGSGSRVRCCSRSIGTADKVPEKTKTKIRAKNLCRLRSAV